MNPTNRCTQTDVEEWLQPVLKELALKNYTITISGNSAKGDGYLGDITFVEVISDLEKYNFVIKSSKKSTEMRNLMPVQDVFKNEFFYYTKILPEFAKFQQEKNVQEPFSNYTKCYGTFLLEDMEVLVLENMKLKGFSLHNRKKPFPRNHVELVMKTYGKLHAISYALKDQKPELFKKLSSELIDVFKKFQGLQDKESDINYFQNIIDAARDENETEVVEKCYELNQIARVGDDITDPNDPYAIILHGDCWNNNFLFKYKDLDENEPTDICLLDFQITRLASPAYDLSYFLFTGLSEDDIEYFDEFINIYYNSLCKNLREMGSMPEKMLPFEELWKQLRKFGKFGIMMVPSIANICLSDEDEVPDLVEAAESDTNLGEMFLRKVRNLKDYKKRTIPIFKLAIKKNII